MELIRQHPLAELKDTIEDFGHSNSLFENSKVLYILPDNISIQNARSFVTKNDPKINNNIEYTTFEKIAKEIIRTDMQNQINDPKVLERYYLHAFVSQGIQELSDKENEIALKIEKILQELEEESSYARENSEIIKNISEEFEEYLRTVYPFEQNKKRNEKFHQRLVTIAENKLSEKSKKEDIIKSLDFYKELHKIAIRKTKKLEEENPSFKRYFLSRAHLVNKATEILKNNKEQDFLSNVEEIKISAVPVFDNTIIHLIRELENNCGSLKIITSLGTHESLKKRLDYEDLTKIENQDIDINNEKWEVPNNKQEVEFCGSLAASNKINPENSIVVSRDSSTYLPYVKKFFPDYGVPYHVQTRRQLSNTIPFRFVNSLFEILLSEKWSPEHIIDPLRLGFVVIKNKFYEEKFLKDKEFLRIEYWLNRKLNNNEDTLNPGEWKNRFSESSITREYISQINKWKEKTLEDEGDLNDKLERIRNKIRGKLRKFQKKASNYQQQNKRRNGLDKKTFNRSEITNNHITSDVERVLRLLNIAADYSEFLAEIDDEDRTPIYYFSKAFWIVGGGETFGKPRRDRGAIKFVDAANSYFLDSPQRVLLGMSSETFPRNYEGGFLLTNEYRKAVNSYSKNEGNGELFIRDSEFDFENEKDFFEAAKGPDFIDNKKIYYLNPYLDERGHKNRWSVFLGDIGEVEHIRPSDFYFEDSNKITSTYKKKPKSKWSKVVLDYYNNNTILESKVIDEDFFKDQIDEKQNLFENLILPRLKCFNNRIISDEQEIDTSHIKNKKPFKKIYRDIEYNKIPTHELDVWNDCPLKYYFYKFVFSIHNWKEAKKTEYYTENFVPDNSELSYTERAGLRKFIPEYWDDFNLGDIPRIITRGYISSDAHVFIRKHIKPLEKGQKNVENVRSKLDNSKLRKNTKENLSQLIDWVEKDNITLGRENGMENTWEWDKSSNIDYIHPPCIVTNDNSPPNTDSSKDYLNIGSYNIYLRKTTQTGYYYGLWIPKEDKVNIKFLNHNQKEELIKEIRGLDVSFNRNEIYNSRNSPRKCDKCVYQKLCGDWRYD